MGSANQLDLLKDRIEYEENIFGKGNNYYEFTDSEDNAIYTLKENPQVGDMTYIYVEQEMLENKEITSVDEETTEENEQTIVKTNSIVVDDVSYNNTEKNIVVYEVYIKVLKRLLKDSKYIALSLRFPYRDYSIIELPKRYYNWQLRCCVEIYQGIGTEGVKSYAENGLSWTRDSGYISYELRGEIEPMVGIIVEEESEDESNNDEEVQSNQ